MISNPYRKPLIITSILWLIMAGICLTPVKASPYRIVKTIQHDYSYKADKGQVWQSAAITEQLKTYDCEDFSVLFRDRMNKEGVKDEEMEFYTGDLQGYGSHAAVKYKGMWIDTFGIHKKYVKFTPKQNFRWSTIDLFTQIGD